MRQPSRHPPSAEAPLAVLLALPSLLGTVRTASLPIELVNLQTLEPYTELTHQTLATRSPQIRHMSHGLVQVHQTLATRLPQFHHKITTHSPQDYHNFITWLSTSSLHQSRAPAKSTEDNRTVEQVVLQGFNQPCSPQVTHCSSTLQQHTAAAHCSPLRTTTQHTTHISISTMTA